ncbi:hypothetical protein GGR54DRAFT_611747, partial [Hypoxylon sp. NC1633]
MTTNPSPSTIPPPSIIPPPSTNPTTSTSHPNQDELAVETFLKKPWATIEDEIVKEVEYETKLMTQLVTQLGAMAKARHYELAGKISKDLKDLERQYEHIISKDKRDATREAILQLAKPFLKVLDLYPDGEIRAFVPWPILADGRILRDEGVPTSKPEGSYDSLATLLREKEKEQDFLTSNGYLSYLRRIFFRATLGWSADVF